MLQLTYLSKAVVPFTEKELAELLRRSRENNESLGISGMLVHRHGMFLQVLEGPEQKVRELFRRIAADPRHEHVDILIEMNVDKPAFADWSMGFFNADDAEMATVPGFTDLFGRSFSRRTLSANPAAACKLLLAFRDGALRSCVEVDDRAAI